MPSFQISDAPVRLDLPEPGADGARQAGRIRFTVRNMGPRAQAGRIRVEPTKGADPGWFSLAGATGTSPAEVELEFDYGGTHDVEVQVLPDAAARAGSYGFKLKVIAEIDTDVDVAEGPEVAFTVKEAPAAPAQTPGKFPWWAVAVAAVMVLLVGGAALWFVLRPGRPAVAMPDLVGSDAGASAFVVAGLGSGVTFATERSDSEPALTVLRSDPVEGRGLPEDRPVALVVAAPTGACNSLICLFPNAEFPAEVLLKLVAAGFDSKFAPALSRQGDRLVLDEARLAQLMTPEPGRPPSNDSPIGVRCPPFCLQHVPVEPIRIRPEILRELESIQRINPGLFRSGE